MDGDMQNEPTWKTGVASSIWPKWPGHSAMFSSHVPHLIPLSIVPSLGSARPPWRGNWVDSSVVSGYSIDATLIFLISSGDKSPNWISSIARNGALEYGKLRFAIFASHCRPESLRKTAGCCEVEVGLGPSPQDYCNRSLSIRRPTDDCRRRSDVTGARYWEHSMFVSWPSRLATKGCLLPASPPCHSTICESSVSAVRLFR